jgi:hypothetical protein
VTPSPDFSNFAGPATALALVVAILAPSATAGDPEYFCDTPEYRCPSVTSPDVVHLPDDHREPVHGGVPSTAMSAISGGGTGHDVSLAGGLSFVTAFDDGAISNAAYRSRRRQASMLSENFVPRPKS